MTEIIAINLLINVLKIVFFFPDLHVLHITEVSQTDSVTLAKMWYFMYSPFFLPQTFLICHHLKSTGVSDNLIPDNLNLFDQYDMTA